MNLTIPRSIWLRGDNQASMLLRKSDGLRCCVGIFLSALGVHDDHLAGNGSASELDDVPAEASWLARFDDEWSSCHDTPVAQDLYRTNDDPDLSEGEREATVARVFADHGVTVNFVD